MSTAKLRRDRRGGSYVLVSSRTQPWRHGPEWTAPAVDPVKTYQERAGAYVDALVRYRLWIREQLSTTPAFLDPLRGRRLACPCAPAVRCPTDILLDVLATFPAETRAVAAR